MQRQPTTQEYRRTGSLFWPEFWCVAAHASLQQFIIAIIALLCSSSVHDEDSDAMCWCDCVSTVRVMDMLSCSSCDLHARSGLCRPLRPCTTCSRSDAKTNKKPKILFFLPLHREHTKFMVLNTALHLRYRGRIARCAKSRAVSSWLTSACTFSSIVYWIV